MKINLVIYFYCTVLSLHSFAQSRSYENIKKVLWEHASAMTKYNQVIGYYFVTLMESEIKGSQYQLTVLDENLKELKTATVDGSKQLQLVSNDFRRGQIILSFYDLKESKTSQLVYDHETNIIQKLAPPSMPTKLTLDNRVDLPGIGSVEYYSQLNGYMMQMNPSPQSTQTFWELTVESEPKEMPTIDFLCYTDELILNVITKEDKKDSGFFVQGVDINTGKIVFEKETIGEFRHHPISAYHEKKNDLIQVLGIYSDKDSKISKDYGLGLFRFTVDATGDISDKKYVAWKGDISKMATVNQKNKLEGWYVYFHEIILNTDGSFIAVGEQYRRAVDGWGIAANLLSTYSTSAVTKVVIQDLILFYFNADFSIRSLEFFGKEKRDFELAWQDDSENIHALSRKVKAAGEFDYRFTRRNEGGEQLVIGYRNYEASGKAFCSISYQDGEFVKYRFPLSEYGLTKILPGTPDHFAFLAWDRKQKQLDIHIKAIQDQ